MKKNLIFAVIVFVCFIFNILLGLVASVAFIAYLFYHHLPDLYMLKGTRAYGTNDTQKALSWYKRAIKTGRASIKGRIYYAILLLRCGFPDDAEKYLTAAINAPTVKPQEKIQAKAFRILAYLKQGRIQESSEELDELYGEVKNSATYGLKGYFMHLMGAGKEETLALCKEAYDYNSEDRDIADNLALSYIKCEMFEEAEELLSTLREKFPTFTEGFYHSALLAKELQDTEKAKEYLAKLDDCNRTYLTTISQEEIDKLKLEVGFDA